jgi:general secretion pathway protein G
MRRHHAVTAARGGFTLLEMLIVVTIIGLIATLIVTNMGDKVGQSKIKVTEGAIANVVSMVEQFNLDVGRYPTEEEGLRALVEKPANADGWSGPYGGRMSLPKDGWSRDFVYEIDDEYGWYVIRSLGSDGQAGGEGDASDIDNRS